MIVPIAHAREIAERIPGAEFHELTGGHFFFFPRTQTNRFAEGRVALSSDTRVKYDNHVRARSLDTLAAC